MVTVSRNIRIPLCKAGKLSFEKTQAGVKYPIIPQILVSSVWEKKCVGWHLVPLPGEGNDIKICIVICLRLSYNSRCHPLHWIPQSSSCGCGWCQGQQRSWDGNCIKGYGSWRTPRTLGSLASHANESAATMLELDGGLVVLERVALLMLLPFSANGKQPTMAGTILGLL